MVDISPNTALLIALQNQFAASRANAPQGNLAAGIPTLTRGPGETGTPGGPGGLATGAVGGGIPTTATTGQSVANALAGGGVGSLGDPVLQQVQRNFLAQREPFSGERPPEPGTAEGEIDPRIILAMATGNPLTIGAAIIRAIASQDRDTFGGGQGQDFGIGPDFGLRESQDTLSTVQGVPFSERETGFSSFGRTTGLAPTPGANIGSLGISFGERERFGPGGPGRGLSRGDISNAGR